VAKTRRRLLCFYSLFPDLLIWLSISGEPISACLLQTGQQWPEQIYDIDHVIFPANFPACWGDDMKPMMIGAAIAALIATPALSADLAVKAPTPLPPPVPVVNWTGCYANAAAGYGMFNQDHQLLFDGSPYYGDPSTTTGGRGWLGLVGGGCDYQFSMGSWGNWVVGGFADYDFMDIHGTFADPTFTGSNPPEFFTGTEKESSAWTIGGRIGILVTPAILTYWNGGYTQSRFDGLTLASPVTSGSYSFGAQTYNGGFIGGGTEIALAGLLGVPLPPGLFWRSEYRYSSFRCANLALSLDGVTLPGYAERSCKDVQTITSSLVWKFNWLGH
jgi:outer membrane immunogenic protein